MHAPTLKRTPLNQFVGMALVLGLAASIAIGIAVHNRSSDDAAPLVVSNTSGSMSAKEARLDRDEAERALADHNAALSASRNRWVDAKERRMDGTADQRAMPTAMQRYYDAKVARQEALELDASALAAQAAQQEKLQQFIVTP